jgi:hypothetical protein
MKVSPATQFQETLVSRALEATRYTPQHKALWRAVYKQAELTIKCRKLTGSAELLVDYWIATAPEWASLSNTIDLDDLQTGFQTIAQEAGADVVPLDSLEEFGDTWQQAPEETEQERLEAALEWRHGLHPVTEPSHLPKWCDAASDPDPESHLEPLRGFEAYSNHYPHRLGV